MGENSETYDFLLKVKNGYDPGWRISKYDELLSDIDFNPKNPGKSKVTIVFDDYNDYLKLFEGLDSNNISQIIDYLNKYYYQSDWVDFQEIRETWDQGYIYDLFDEENKNLFEKISIYISSVKNLEIGDQLKSFREEFSDPVENMFNEFSAMEHNCKLDKLHDEMIEEFGNKFSRFGIRESVPLYKYITNVDILLKLFKTFELEEKDLFGLLKKIIDMVHPEKYYRELYEYYYKTGCDDDEIDKHSFNKETNWYLQRILDKIEDSEEYENVKEYFELKTKLLNQYEFGSWNILPRTENIAFRIDEINPKNNKITITIRNSNTNREEKRSLSYEELKQFETQYELFNEIKKIKKFFII